jgi:hypothetical protein
MISTASTDRWEDLGALLVQRRTALNPRWHNRTAFAEATGLSYRLVYDVEEARRTNFGNSALAAIEAAYRLEPGTIGRFLAGGQLEYQSSPQEVAPQQLRPTGIRVIDEAVSKENNLEPFIREIRQEIADAVAEYGPEVSGEEIFGPGYEANAWNSGQWSPDETVTMLALFRSFAARNVGGESGARTGLNRLRLLVGSP